MLFRRILLMTISLLVLLFGIRAVELASDVRSLGEISASAAEDAAEAKPEDAKPAKAEAPEAEDEEAAAAKEDAESKESHDKEGEESDPAAKDAAKDAAAADPAAAESADAGAKAAQEATSPLMFTPSELDVLQQLSDRREQLEARDRAISRKESLLKVSEERIEQKIAELNTMRQEMLGIRDEIKTLLGQVDEKEAKEVTRLVKIYETMKPKDAARIFDTLDMPVLMQVISRMKEAKTAPILAAMQAEKAKQVTGRMAGDIKRPDVGPILDMPDAPLPDGLPPLPQP
jgi:flagellar motility protein MotE (MotC chaperone)